MIELNSKIIIISGPTATGKTGLAIKLAKLIGSSEIINFDSLLFYKEINIGTAKPTLEEMGGIRHHLIDIASIKNPLNAHDYQKMAEEKIVELTNNNITPILVGGSGFYLRALTHGMYVATTTPTEILKKSDELFLSQGITPFLSFLEINDPETFSILHPNDHYRIRRAVEYFWCNQRKISDAKKELEIKKETNAKINLSNFLHFYLDIPKEDHLKIIEKRTDLMINLGLIDEVKTLLENGFTGDEKPLQSIGYFEVLEFLQGKIKSIEELKEKINISTRQLAKSQRTWFKKINDKISVNPLQQFDFIKNSVHNYLISK